jgi:hypothetical protein
MKIKTADLTGAALDWAVALCEGMVEPFTKNVEHDHWVPSINWAQGGPIIEREGICLVKQDVPADNWWAFGKQCGPDAFGPTPLIAAMRCFVASRLGDEVEVPDELLGA